MPCVICRLEHGGVALRCYTCAECSASRADHMCDACFARTCETCTLKARVRPSSPERSRRARETAAKHTAQEFYTNTLEPLKRAAKLAQSRLECLENARYQLRCAEDLRARMPESAAVELSPASMDARPLEQARATLESLRAKLRDADDVMRVHVSVWPTDRERDRLD